MFPNTFLKKNARVTALHKGGDNTDVNNYRPISVLPTVYKIFEKNSLQTIVYIFD